MAVFDRFRKLLADLEASLQPPEEQDLRTRLGYDVDHPDVAARPVFDTRPGASEPDQSTAAATPGTGPPPQATRAGARRTWLRAQLMQPESARRAVLLKEVLDRPLAFRRRR